MPEANLSSLEHWSCEPPEQTVFSLTDGQAEVKAGTDAGGQSKASLWEQDGHDECHSVDIWTKVCAPLFLNLVGFGWISKGPVLFSGGSVRTSLSSWRPKPRERVIDAFKLATGVSWIYLSRAVAFHICMHTSHAYTNSHALAWCFSLSWDQSGLAVWQPLGCYTSP